MKHRYLMQFCWIARARYLGLLAFVVLGGCEAVLDSRSLISSTLTSRHQGGGETVTATEAVPIDDGGETPGNTVPTAPNYGPGSALAVRMSAAQPTEEDTTQEKSSSAAPEGTGRASSGRALLVKAAELLDRGDSEGASLLLVSYLDRNPEAVIVRLQLGELYCQAARWEAARVELERALGAMEESSDLPLRYLLHGHSRLLDIAAAQGERFAEELHRGIGLALLAERRSQETSGKGAPAEELYGRALKALQGASRLRGTDARPYLHRVPVWRAMGQESSARLDLARAQAVAVTTPLNQTEWMMIAKWGVELGEWR